ncbi:hypothetical protein SO802_009814 [Lithocarpus litseifolius]|uniref:NFD4 C-terminal domain-containing protein n=1 Tax=Lithocarpus litseifolius TaxID=425828 RepID=A0AAW2DEM9_9ROSI
MEKDRLIVLGEEHPARLLVRRWDFWLYYLAYFCGGTLGLVYSNNLGQISESLGYSTITSSLVTLYSTCSFFGRLLSAAPDFLRDKIYFARTGWLAVALVPTPIAFFLLASSGSEAVLRAGTGLIGLSSGFLFSAAVSITSELFGPNSAGINHNILITNIPIGSLLYGLLAALVYDSNAGGSALSRFLGETLVCMDENLDIPVKSTIKETNNINYSRLYMPTNAVKFWKSLLEGTILTPLLLPELHSSTISHIKPSEFGKSQPTSPNGFSKSNTVRA